MQGTQRITAEPGQPAHRHPAHLRGRAQPHGLGHRLGHYVCTCRERGCLAQRLFVSTGHKARSTRVVEVEIAPGGFGGAAHIRSESVLSSARRRGDSTNALTQLLDALAGAGADRHRRDAYQPLGREQTAQIPHHGSA